MDMKKLNPWNWFKHEENRLGGNVPVQRRNAPAPAWPLMPLHQEIDRLFDDVFRSFGLPAFGSSRALDPSDGGTLRPSVDIDASDTEYRITVEVPGVDEKDIQVELGGDGSLHIRGEKRQEREDKERNVYRVERSYGSFERVLAMPEDVEAEGIKAEFRNGVLSIRLPRSAQARSSVRRIAIQTGEGQKRLAA